MRRHEKEIDDYLYLKFIWKCFGDGIAFTYLDKFGLKHLFFNTADYTVKQDAGALAGKAGLRAEFAAVCQLQRIGIPALLCDITNTLRHGDVCILVGPDPVPVEIKSSKNRNSRAKRQIQSIRSLAKFLANDEAQDFRGFPSISRVEIGPPEITHLDALDRCLSEATTNGLAVVSPEAGLHYVCARLASGLDALNPLIRNPNLIFVDLNEIKCSRNWAPYFPFTLSIRDPHCLYEFIRGDIWLATFVDKSEVVRQFSDLGFDARLFDRDDYAVGIRRRKDGLIAAASRSVFFRMFVEFQSLGWFVAAQCDLNATIKLAKEKEMASESAVTMAQLMSASSEWLLRAFDESDAVSEAPREAADP